MNQLIQSNTNSTLNLLYRSESPNPTGMGSNIRCSISIRWCLITGSASKSTEWAISFSINELESTCLEIRIQYRYQTYLTFQIIMKEKFWFYDSKCITFHKPITSEEFLALHKLYLVLMAHFLFVFWHRALLVMRIKYGIRQKRIYIIELVI